MPLFDVLLDQYCSFFESSVHLLQTLAVFEDLGMSLLLKFDSIIQSRLVEARIGHVSDLLHGEHSGLLESFRLEVLHVLRIVTFHSTHPWHISALHYNISHIVVIISKVFTLTEGEVSL